MGKLSTWVLNAIKRAHGGIIVVSVPKAKVGMTHTRAKRSNESGNQERKRRDHPPRLRTKTPVVIPLQCLGF